jgi:hypothetical protein
MRSREHWTVAESDGAIFWDGPVKSLGAVAYPVDDHGRAQLDLRLRHAGGTAYELVDWPSRKRHLRAEIVQPVCWPDGSPYKTEVFRLDLEVADRDVNWNSDYVVERKLCDGRRVTVRMAMSAWREKDHLRVTKDPIVVDVAAIAPPALPAPVQNAATTDALTDAAAAVDSAARALAASALATPVKRAKFYDKNGELEKTVTVTTERRGSEVLHHFLTAAGSLETNVSGG